jgi:hypothetical protein
LQLPSDGNEGHFLESLQYISQLSSFLKFLDSWRSDPCPLFILEVELTLPNELDRITKPEHMSWWQPLWSCRQFEWKHFWLIMLAILRTTAVVPTFFRIVLDFRWVR